VPALVACASLLLANAIAAAEPARSKQPKGQIDRPFGDFPECGRPGTCRKTVSTPEPPLDPFCPPLTRAEMLAEMKKVEPEVRACARPVDVGKYVVVSFGIGRDGRVVTATATGRLGGTPVGACVEKAVKTIRFRENPGLDLAFPFVFKPRRKAIREPKPVTETAGAGAAAGPAPSEPPVPEKVEMIGPIICCTECGPNGHCPKEGVADREPPPGPLGPPLTHDEISTEMRLVESDVRACGRPADVGKMVVVRLVIDVSGRVTTAIATGPFEGTPTGACVEQKVKSVQFRSNDGVSLIYAFPFKANAAMSPVKEGN
jgi:hypothetical protein